MDEWESSRRKKMQKEHTNYWTMLLEGECPKTVSQSDMEVGV